MKKKLFRALIMATLTSCSLLPFRGAAAQVIDQLYTPSTLTFGLFYDANTPLGQTFSPQSSAPTNFIQLRLSDDQFGTSGVGGTFRTRIRVGDSLGATTAGAILGVSDAVVLPDLFGTFPSTTAFGGSVVDFRYSTPLLLTVNAAYTIELVRDSGDNFILYGVQPGGYARGAGIDEGGSAANAGNTQDFWFRQGFLQPAVVPEPSALPLLAMGAMITSAGILCPRIRHTTHPLMTNRIV